MGARLEVGPTAGVNGDQGTDSGPNAGAAYVFVRDGTTWIQQAYLKAANPGINDFFGTSVAISGDTIVIGASGEDSNATGVNGNSNNDNADGAGAAYVFHRSFSGGTPVWTQQAYLKASNTGPDDDFGSAVAISGDTIVVGARGDDSGATGVNGNPNDTSAPASGAIFVFGRSGTTWSEQAYLKASNTGASDNFGNGVAISGNTVVIGPISRTAMPRESTGTKPIIYPQTRGRPTCSRASSSLAFQPGVSRLTSKRAIPV